MKINHVGYLVKRIEKAKEVFLQLGFVQSCEQIYDHNRDVWICFLEKDGYCVELISPVSERSVVYNMLKKYGNSPYHICYSTDHFDTQLNELESNGFFRIDDPAPAPALGNRKVCFLQNSQIGMIELLEE